MTHSLLPVIMAGGSGTRLWPLSRALYPKQFLILTGNQSLFQQAHLRLQSLAAADIAVTQPCVVGNEELRSSAEGRSYGVEAMARWQIPGKVNLVGSVTLFRSEYRRDSAAPYIVSAWDSRFVVNLSGTYDLPRSWSVGARLSAVGGTPYTPYDVGKSSLVEAWNVQGRPYYDYTRYNDGRLDAFAQLDLQRVGLFIRAWKKVERLSRQSLANPKPMPLFTKKKDR
jgi:hypothetical protein